MINKEKLREYAKKLMFDMEEAEYNTLQQEFVIFIKQMELISKIDNISSVEPMTYPFELNTVSLRDDEVENLLSTKEVMANAKEVERNQIKVPKVVE